MDQNRFYLRLALSFVAVLAVFCPFVAFANSLPPRDLTRATQQILALVEKNDVLIFGEQHSLRDARRLLMSVLKHGIQSGAVDAFSTEYVLEEVEADFQAYLTDASAVRGSVGEASFFAKMNATNYVWLKDELNKDFFRFLRDLKLAHPQVAICGLDARGSSDREVRRSSFQRLPKLLLQAAQKAFRLDVESMVEDVNSNFDRETLMAMHTVNCIGQAKRSIVHVGAYHAWSLSYDATQSETAEEKKQSGWMAMSQFLPVLMPGQRVVTVATAQEFSDTPDSIVSAYAAAHAVFHKNDLTSLSLLRTSTASAELKSILQIRLDSGRMQEIWPVWDYLILGPRGDDASLWN